MKKKSIIIIFLFSIFILLLLFIMYLKANKNIINLNIEKSQIEQYCSKYIDTLNSFYIDKAITFLYQKPENDIYTPYYKDFYDDGVDLKNFKINNIIQINKYLCQLDAEFDDLVHKEHVYWKPYIVKIKGNLKIVLNQRDIPNLYKKNLIVEDNDIILDNNPNVKLK